MSLKSLYDVDYQLWLDETLAQLKAKDFASLDLDNLIEEIESLGRSDKRSLSSYLMRLCEHLLKIQYWEAGRERCLRGWDVEITNFRLQIQEGLETSPSLRAFLQEVFPTQYTNARKLFLKMSELDPAIISDVLEFSLEQALDDDWLPPTPKNQDSCNGR